MTEREMAAEQAAAREMALYADHAKREDKRATSAEASYIASLIRSQGWTGAELRELGQQYDYEARRER